MLAIIASPASATLVGGASGGNGSQTHVGTVVGGNPIPCAGFRSFDGVTRFRGGNFTTPAFTAVTTDVTVTAGPSTSVIYYAGPYGTYPVSSTPCSGSPVAVPGFRITVRAVDASGGVLTCVGNGTFLRNGSPAVNATFDFPGSTCGSGTTGRITLTARTVQPCVIAPTPATCAYEPNSATLSFDGTGPQPTTQPPCIATYVVTVPKDADRPTSFYMIYGDGVYQTIAIPQGSGWAQHSFSHQFPSAGIYRQTVTIVETGAFAEKKTVVGANGCLAP